MGQRWEILPLQKMETTLLLYANVYVNRRDVTGGISYVSGI